jgi:hypothetical protein
MKLERIFISYMLVFPLFLIITIALLLSSWTIERFHLKKEVPILPEE